MIRRACLLGTLLCALLRASIALGQLALQGAGPALLGAGGGPSVPTFNWQNNVYGSTVGTSATLTSGGTIHVGDLLVAVVAVSNYTPVDPGAIAPPGGGWTLVSLGTFQSIQDTTTAVFTHIAGSSESGSYVFTWTNSNLFSWTLLDYGGANASAPLDGTPGDNQYNGAYVATMDAPSLTATGTADLLLCVWSYGLSSPATLPGGMVSRVNQVANSFNRPWLGVADLALSGAGATAIQSATPPSIVRTYEAISLLVTH